MKNLNIDTQTHRQLLFLGYKLAAKGFYFDNEIQLMEFIVDRVTEVTEGNFHVDYTDHVNTGIAL